MNEVNESFQIGWYVLKEDKVFRDNGYETAAWFKDINVKAGCYPVTAKLDRSEKDGHLKNEINYMSVYIRLNGTVVAEDFQSRYFGVPIGNDNPKYIGTEGDMFLHPYAFSVAEDALNNKGDIKLADGFVPYKYNFTDFNNQPCSTHKIACTDAKFKEIESYVSNVWLASRISRIDSLKDFENSVNKTLPESYTMQAVPPVYNEVSYEVYNEKKEAVINILVNAPSNDGKPRILSKPLVQATAMEITIPVPELSSPNNEKGVAGRVAAAKEKAASQGKNDAKTPLKDRAI